MVVGAAAAVAELELREEHAVLADHGIEKIFRDMTSELITAQPAAPVEFMIDYLRTTHGGADAKGSGSGGAQAKDAQYKDEGKDDDPPPDSEDEDDEGDYADFEPIKPQLATKKRKRKKDEEAAAMEDNPAEENPENSSENCPCGPVKWLHVHHNHGLHAHALARGRCVRGRRARHGRAREPRRVRGPCGHGVHARLPHRQRDELREQLDKV